jgi:hypothetical protein
MYRERDVWERGHGREESYEHKQGQRWWLPSQAEQRGWCAKLGGGTKRDYSPAVIPPRQPLLLPEHTVVLGTTPSQLSFFHTTYNHFLSHPLYHSVLHYPSITQPHHPSLVHVLHSVIFSHHLIPSTSHISTTPILGSVVFYCALSITTSTYHRIFHTFHTHTCPLISLRGSNHLHNNITHTFTNLVPFHTQGQTTHRTYLAVKGCPHSLGTRTDRAHNFLERSGR